MLKIWISLVLLTLLSFLMGYLGILTTSLVLVLLGGTFIKGALVSEYFMGLRSVGLRYRIIPILWLIVVLGMIGLAYYLPIQKSQSLEVTATAYTSSKDETDDTPFTTAWGDTLKPGMKCIAISRDLIKMGLKHGVEVRIDGFEGRYLVLDKMNKRWTKKIDIYMGEDKKSALKWGKQRVIIHWNK